jgi:aerobic carbon-monoxide dehydrogenase large subunit
VAGMNGQAHHLQGREDLKTQPMSNASTARPLEVPYTGRSVPRVEDLRFITGRGNYSDDVRIDGEVYCAFVRSPHSHAKIVRIDRTSVLAMPGVLAVLTGQDYAQDGCLPVDHAPNPADAIDVRKRAFSAQGDRVIHEQRHWPLAIDIARGLGEPVVAVIAQSQVQAQDAAEAVRVEYEALPAATSIADAIREDAPQIWSGIPRNCCLTFDAGDAEAVDRAFNAAAHIIRHTFHTNRIVNCQLEPRAAVGVYDSTTGEFCLISGNQGVTKLQTSIAPALGVDKSELRVICPDVGGGFGPRTYVYAEQVVVLWAARRLNRPVRWTSTRSEAFLTDYQGRDNLTHVALALDRRGKALALRVEFYAASECHANADDRLQDSGGAWSHPCHRDQHNADSTLPRRRTAGSKSFHRANV